MSININEFKMARALTCIASIIYTLHYGKGMQPYHEELQKILMIQNVELDFTRTAPG